jgi:hypothetical protein
MKQDQQPEIIFSPEGRYLSLHGHFIDQLGSQSDTIVSDECIENRKKRDGDGHHITVINHLEIFTFISKEEAGSSKSQQKKKFRKTQFDTYNALQDRFGPASEWELPEDLGMGICVHQDAIAYFRVVHWPFGQMMRSCLGLKQSNFHVTVGFSPQDVHLYKGPASLLCLKPDQFCSRERMAKLVSLVYYYAEDNDFIKALRSTCWRHGYYQQLFCLTTVHITCKFFKLKFFFLKIG